MDASGNIISSHESFKKIRTFELLREDGSSKLVTRPGIYTSDHEMFTLEGEILAWAESAFHPRYRNRIYSVVKFLNLSTGKIRQLSHRSRYFSPAPSKDGKYMLVVAYDAMNNCSLQIIELASGLMVSSHAYKNEFLAQARWINDKEVVVISVGENGNKLLILNWLTDHWKIVFDAGDVNISRPFPYKSSIYFSSGLSGIENIYRIDMETEDISQLTNARFGAFDPSVYDDVLYLFKLQRQWLRNQAA